MSGLTAAWILRREGHRVLVFERNYKPGGRMNSRRKAGLVVDHGDRYITRDSPVLRELIVDCGLLSETRSINRPIYTLLPDGSYLETPEQAVNPNRITFPDGLLMLAEALRRSLGGFYSIGVDQIERDEVLGKFILRTNPPMRVSETQVDGVLVACCAPETLKVIEPVRQLFCPEFLEKIAQVRYTRCLSLIAATQKIDLPQPLYGLFPPETPESLLMWLAFEDQKCEGRGIEGWSSIIAHANPRASEELWQLDEPQMLERLYAEARRLVPQIPAKWRWGRIKRWDIARLKDASQVVSPEEYPTAPDNVLIEVCGDYRIGDGVEQAAESGRDAAERLLRKIEPR